MTSKSECAWCAAPCDVICPLHDARVEIASRVTCVAASAAARIAASRNASSNRHQCQLQQQQKQQTFFIDSLLPRNCHKLSTEKTKTTTTSCSINSASSPTRCRIRDAHLRLGRASGFVLSSRHTASPFLSNSISRFALKLCLFSLILSGLVSCKPSRPASNVASTQPEEKAIVESSLSRTTNEKVVYAKWEEENGVVFQEEEIDTRSAPPKITQRRRTELRQARPMALQQPRPMALQQPRKQAAKINVERPRKNSRVQRQQLQREPQRAIEKQQQPRPRAPPPPRRRPGGQAPSVAKYSSNPSTSHSAFELPEDFDYDDFDGFNDTAALERLLHVFGLGEGVSAEDARHRASRLRHKTPPQYMMELYEAVSDGKTGVTTGKNPYDADVVRGFPDKERKFQQTSYQFKVDHKSVPWDEEIIAAEFHVFKMKPRPKEHRDWMIHHQGSPRRRRWHIVEIQLFQVIDPSDRSNPEKQRLIHTRRISSHTIGWEVFNVTVPIRHWMNDTMTNHGFLLLGRTLQGTYINGSHFRIAQRAEHHDSKQPILVLFTKERQKMYHYVSPFGAPEDASKMVPDYTRYIYKAQGTNRNAHFLNEGVDTSEMPGSPVADANEPQIDENRVVMENDAAVTQAPTPERIDDEIQNSPEAEDDAFDSWDFLSAEESDASALSATTHRRVRRETRYKFPKHRKPTCARHELYVDFEEIGWSGWIISPKGYNAYHCKGACPFPLGQNQKPTNHATVQSIVNALRLGKGVETPCCVPNKLYSISLLYFDDDENVVLKQYDDMVAASCGCH